MNRLLQGLAVLSATLMYLVVQMGALVTNTGSADGCGESWPLCKGSWMPNWDYAAIIEFSHRAVAGLGGLLVLALAIWVWRAVRRRAVRLLALTGLLLVGLQGGLGALAVIWPQPKAVLALHFGISLLCFGAVLLVAVLLVQGGPMVVGAPVSARFRRAIWHLAGFSYAVTYLGAYVRHTGSSGACMGWPLCSGEWIPALWGPTGANFAHRVGAALTLLLVVRLALLARSEARARPDLRRGCDLALLLAGLQVAEGAVIALGSYNLLTRMLHTAILALLWGVLSYLCLAASPVARRYSVGVGAPG